MPPRFTPNLCCRFGYDDTTCTAPITNGNCEWHATENYCTKKGDEVPCSLYYGDNDDEFGMKCPLDRCDKVESEEQRESYGNVEISYRCVEKGEILACEEYNSFESSEVLGATCPQDRCKYHFCPLNLCWSSDSEPPCEYYPPKACVESAKCKWKHLNGGNPTDGECAECPAGTDCSDVWHGPDEDECDNQDTGKECNTYEVFDCPYPRCREDYNDDPNENPFGNPCPNGAEVDNGVCRDPECKDLFGESECRAKTECTYDSNADLCYDANDMSKFSCFELYDKSNCEAAPYGSVCQFVMVEPQYDEGECIPKSEPVKCSLFYSEEGCTTADAAKSLGCRWDSATSYCLRADEETPCGAYYGKEECEAELRCKFYDIDDISVCLEADKDLPCSCLSMSSYGANRTACLDTGYCSYEPPSQGNEGHAECKQCPVTSAGIVCPGEKLCSEYSARDCPYERCEKTYIPASKTEVCGEPPCRYKYNKEECLSPTVHQDGRGCHWTDMGEDDGLCWPDHLPHVCNTIYTEDFCTNTAKLPPPEGWGIECEFSNYECRGTNELPPCWEYYESADKCNEQSTCKWSDGECVFDSDASKNVPDPADELDGNGDGTGNEDSSKCTDDLFATVKTALEEASEQCVEIGRRSRRQDGYGYEEYHREATTGQLKCLEYFLGQIEGAPQTLKTACPCIWLWAEDMDETYDWMLIKC